MFPTLGGLTGGHQNANVSIHPEYFNTQILRIFSIKLGFKLTFKKTSVLGRNKVNATEWVWDREVSPLPVIAAEDNFNVFSAMFNKYILHLSRAEEEVYDFDEVGATGDEVL